MRSMFVRDSAPAFSKNAPAHPSERPCASINWILPASVSEMPRTMSKEALPNSRNMAFPRRSSQMGRSVAKISGRRCTSSITTSPSLSRSTVSGLAASASRLSAASRSKSVAGPFQDAMSCSASVVLPTCRAPSSATTGDSDSPSRTRSKSDSRGINSIIVVYPGGKEQYTTIIWMFGDGALPHPLRSATPEIRVEGRKPPPWPRQCKSPVRE